MTLKGSIAQSQVFSKVAGTVTRRQAFKNYAAKMKKIVGPPTGTPKNLIWCPCKAPAYFEKLNKSLPSTSPAKPVVRALLNKIK